MLRSEDCLTDTSDVLVKRLIAWRVNTNFGLPVTVSGSVRTKR